MAEDLYSQPNIVILLVEDMGYGDPGCSNAKSNIATAQIDALARDGMRFTDAHAPGQIYNLAEDIGESTNLFAQHLKIVFRLKV